MATPPTDEVREVKVWRVRTLAPQRNIYRVTVPVTDTGLDGLEAWKMVQFGADGVEFVDTEPFDPEEEELLDVEEIQEPV